MKLYYAKAVGEQPEVGDWKVYFASDVDIREQQATATIQAQRRKIEALEKALRFYANNMGESRSKDARIMIQDGGSVARDALQSTENRS